MPFPDKYSYLVCQKLIHTSFLWETTGAEKVRNFNNLLLTYFQCLPPTYRVEEWKHFWMIEWMQDLSSIFIIEVEISSPACLSLCFPVIFPERIDIREVWTTEVIFCFQTILFVNMFPDWNPSVSLFISISFSLSLSLSLSLYICLSRERERKTEIAHIF